MTFPASGRETSVLTVLVTRTETPWLSTTISALAAQRTPPGRVVLAVTDPGAVVPLRERFAPGPIAELEVVSAAGAATLGDAVRTVLRDHPAVPGQWLWLLHDDSAPEPDALYQQLRAVEQSPSVVVAGAKQVEWDRPDELISVGVGMTRSARRFTALEEHEIDQGQYDDRADVLAVGTAGMLIRREVWDQLGGTDPALGPFGDGADLTRRARLAGHRAIVVPAARVRHARASYVATRPAGADGAVGRPDPVRSWSARRRAQLHSRLSGASPLGAVAAFIGMFLLAPLRALGRLATKEFSLVGAELRAPFRALADLGRVHRARSRARTTAVLPRRVLRPLQVGVGTRLATWRDTRLHRAAVRRAARARSELEIAEVAAMARRRRWALLGTMVVVLGVTAVTLGRLAFDGVLTGGALLPTDATTSQLWTLATSPWLPVGDGHALLPEPFLFVLAGLSTLTGGLWGTSVSVSVGILLLGALPLAALGAWFAAGAATRSLPVRAWAAAAWAFTPPLLTGVAQGRIGAVTAHLALPWVALGVARALGIQRRDVVLSGMVGAKRVHATAAEQDTAALSPRGAAGPTPAPVVGSIAAAAGAGLALAVACASAPVLLPISIVALILLALVVPRARVAGRGRLLLVIIPSIVLLGPWLTRPFTREATPASDALDEVVRMLTSEPGQPLNHATPRPWQSLLLWPTDISGGGLAGGATEVLALVTGALVVLAAVVALLRGGPVARGVRTAWLLALVGLAAALAAPWFAVGLDGAVVATAWPGPMLSFFLLGLLAAAALGGDRLRHRLGGAAFGWRQGGAGLVAVLVGLAPLVGGGLWVVQALRTDDVHLQARGGNPVPALGRQVQSSPAAARVLSLLPTAESLNVQLWRGDGPQLVDGSLTTMALRGAVLNPTLTPPDDAEQSLAIAVARLTVSADEAVPMLREHAVSVVVVPRSDSAVRPGADPTAIAELSAALDGTAGLERVTTNDSGTIWRVVGEEGVARARVLDADGAPSDSVTSLSRDLPVGGLSSGLVRATGEVAAADQDRVVVLSERAGDGWTARVDGTELEPTTADWRQAWILPAAAEGTVEISYSDPARTPWVVTQIVVLALAVLLALPTRRRIPGEAP